MKKNGGSSFSNARVSLGGITRGIIATAIGTGIVALLGLDSLPSITPWANRDSTTTITTSAAPSLSTINSSLGAPATSTIPAIISISPTTPTTKPPSKGKKETTTTTLNPNTPATVKTQSGSVLSTSSEATAMAWDEISLPTDFKSAWFLKVGKSSTVGIENPEFISVDGSSCKKVASQIRFVAEGLCTIKVFRSAKATDFKSFGVRVRERTATNLADRNTLSRNIYINEKKLNDWVPFASTLPFYRAYGKEVPLDLLSGDVAKKWRMKLLITMPQEFPQAKCLRIFTRYGTGMPEGLWAGDSTYSMSAPDCSAATSMESFSSCVQFEPAKTNGKSNGGIIDVTDELKKYTYSYLGWAIDWSFPNMMPTPPSSGPKVELQEFQPGTC